MPHCGCRATRCHQAQPPASTTNRWRPPLYPENEAPKTPGDEAAGLSTPKYETSISLNSLHEHTKPRRSEGCEASQRPAI